MVLARGPCPITCDTVSQKHRTPPVATAHRTQPIQEPSAPMKSLAFRALAAAAITALASSASFGAVVYTSTSTSGLNVSTATRPMLLDDISFAASSTARD